MNVNIVDREKAEKNVELKKKKPEYKPYNEEESVDDMVTVSFADRISMYQFFLDFTIAEMNAQSSKVKGV